MAKKYLDPKADVTFKKAFDRKWLGSPSEFTYNLFASLFSLGYNGLLEATRPKVKGTSERGR